MRKKIILLMIGLITISSVFAQELPSPGTLPDHPFYGIKRWWEGVRMFFTFDEKAKTGLQFHFAEIRLAEAKAMTERGKLNWTKDLIEDYRSRLNEVENHMEEQRRMGRSIADLSEHVANMTYKHISVLEEVLEKVPEEAKLVIEHAINVSVSGHIQATKRIGEEMPERQIELSAEFCEMSLEDVREMIERKRIEWAKRRLQIYGKMINETEEVAERIGGLGRNVTALTEHICNMTYKHILVLERELEKIPEEAKPAIEHAINISMERQATCMERILKIINRSVEREKWRVCTSDEDCVELPIYCPATFKYEITCYIPPNKTEGICHCWPKWKKTRFNCTVDADCRHLICPTVLGSDTPVCEGGRCRCGARWEIANRTEWKERFGEEWTGKVQERMEKISKMYNKTDMEVRLEKIIPEM